MPRRSAAALRVISVDGPSSRLHPPASLSQPQRRLFIDLVSACDPRHFVLSDLPLLCRYCEAAALAETADKELRQNPVVNGKVSAWLVVQEKAVRSMIALSMRLRLSPQSRMKVPPKPTERQSYYEGEDDDAVED